MNDHLTNISKYISLVLRHRPDKIGLKLDKEGWAFVSELCLKAGVSKSDLCKVVEQNSKQRFAFNGDKSKIRASQGHSINVDLKLAEIKPPMFLYHGTAVQFLTDIREKGLLKMNRQHVHLSFDRDTATKVGSRHGVCKVLTVKSQEMFEQGFKFYKSENGVWLTDNVPAKYLQF